MSRGYSNGDFERTFSGNLGKCGMYAALVAIPNLEPNRRRILSRVTDPGNKPNKHHAT